MGRKLILADGTTIEGGEAGYSGGFLWLWFTGLTIMDAGAIFFNRNITSVIRFEYGEMEDVYNGFTACRTLQVDEDGNVSVCMAKE